MAAAKLTKDEQEFLEVLMEHDPEAEYALGFLHFGFGPLYKKLGMSGLTQVLSALRRRKLIGAEGRGKWATFWIEEKGKEALAAAQEKSGA